MPTIHVYGVNDAQLFTNAVLTFEIAARVNVPTTFDDYDVPIIIIPCEQRSGMFTVDDVVIIAIGGR